MVLVDPMNEDMTIDIHNHIEALRPAVLFIHGALGSIGFFRLMAGDPGSPPHGFTEREWSSLAAMRMQTKSMVASGKEPPLWMSGELARRSGRFGDIPVTVLTAGIQDQEEDPQLDRSHSLKVRLHAKLARQSGRGKQVIVQSGHQIPWDAPGAVVEAVLDALNQLRPSSPVSSATPATR